MEIIAIKKATVGERCRSKHDAKGSTEGFIRVDKTKFKSQDSAGSPQAEII